MSMRLEDMITRRFAPPEFVSFFEVSAVFDGHQRRADVVSFCVWPSRGLLVHGFEVKSDRRDWLRELKDPSKAEAVLRHCDRWWLVTRPNVAKLEEIPEPWGWLEEKGDKLFTRKEAPKLPGSLTMEKYFASCLLRRVNDTHVTRHQLDEAIVLARKEAMEQVARQNDPTSYDGDRVRKELATLRERVEHFAEASGVDIDTWADARKMGGAFKIAMRIVDGDTSALLRDLEWSRDRVAQATTRIDEVIADVKRGAA